MDFPGPSSPLFSLTGSDMFWDGSVANPVSTTSVVTSPIPSMTCSGVSGSSSQNTVIPTIATVTHTFSRPVNTTGSVSTVPGMCMGLNLPGSRPQVCYYGSVFTTPGAPPVSSWSRPPWPQPYPYGQYPGQNPFPNFWPPPPMHLPFGGYGRVPDDRSSSATVAPTTCSNSTPVVNQDFLKDFKDTLSEFKKSFQSDLVSLSNRLSVLESAPQTVASSISSPVRQDEEEDREDDLISTAPGSQEGEFLDHEEADSPPPPRTIRSNSSVHAVRIDPSVDDGSPRDPEADDAPPSKEHLRSRVYTLMRDVAKVPFSSPPKPKRLASTFEASCGLVPAQGSSYSSFPESPHISSAKQIVDDFLGNKVSEKQASGKFAGFRPATFASHFKVKDFDIFDSTLGKFVPTCDKNMSALLSSKPVDGLRLSQASWSNSENMLRVASQVLGTGEHYLSSVGSLLQGQDSELLSEVKSFLLQLDRCLGASQLLLMGTLANFTLSKRSEILEKSNVSENLKDSLLKSPLTDKIFGLSLEQVQEAISKNPPPVKVNVQVSNGKRSVSSSSAPAGPSFNKRRKIVKKSKPSSTSTAPQSSNRSTSFKGPQKSSSRP